MTDISAQPKPESEEDKRLQAQREEYRQKIQIGRALDGADEATVRSRIALLARTIFAEAANHYRTQGAMEGIGWAAVNRVGAPRFPNTLEAVIYKPEQFAVGNVRWNMAADPDKLTGPDARAYEQALNVARGILTGNVPDSDRRRSLFLLQPKRRGCAQGFLRGRTKRESASQTTASWRLYVCKRGEVAGDG